MQARQTHATRLPMLLRALAFALLVAAPVASAQQPAPRPIEQQMSAAERAATGVDTLNADQLAALNAWLNRTLEVETAKAAEAAKATVVEQARGFFNFGSEEPIRSTIPTVAGVMGMAHGRFQMANVLSAILWMPLMLAPGYITASSLGAAENAQQIAMMIGAGLSVLLGCGLLVAMMRKRRQPARIRRGN